MPTNQDIHSLFKNIKKVYFSKKYTFYFKHIRALSAKVWLDLVFHYP